MDVFFKFESLHSYIVCKKTFSVSIRQLQVNYDVSQIKLLNPTLENPGIQRNCLLDFPRYVNSSPANPGLIRVSDLC